jgi:hypothetical protein
LNTQQIKRSARVLPLRELRDLEAWLHRFIKRAEKAERLANARRG